MKSRSMDQQLARTSRTIIYTSIINNFLVDRFSINDIITFEQAGGNKGS